MSFVCFFQAAFHNLEVRLGKKTANLCWKVLEEGQWSGTAAGSEAGLTGQRASCLGSKLSLLPKILRKERPFRRNIRYKGS